jgi:hypothetical protein
METLLLRAGVSVRLARALRRWREDPAECLRRARADCETVLRRRADVQRALEEGLALVNDQLGPELSARFVVTLGDEFQGLLRVPELAIDTLNRLDEALDGMPLRYAAGWGVLSTPLRPHAVGMDGPCFHAARDALARGKRERRWATVEGFGAEPDRILNAILGLLGEVRARWKPTQAATVRAMRHAATQKEVAADRGVTESTVSKALKSAMFDAVLETEQALALLMSRFAAAPRDER